MFVVNLVMGQTVTIGLQEIDSFTDPCVAMVYWRVALM